MSLARELSGPGRAGESGEVEPSRMMPARETERMMKLQDVILKAMAKKITWIEAAEIIGVSDGTMRRMRDRYQEHGYNGLFDQRRGKRRHPSRSDGDRPSRCWGSTGTSTSISTCGTFTRSCARSTTSS